MSSYWTSCWGIGWSVEKWNIKVVVKSTEPCDSIAWVIENTFKREKDACQGEMHTTRFKRFMKKSFIFLCTKKKENTKHESLKA